MKSLLYQTSRLFCLVIPSRQFIHVSQADDFEPRRKQLRHEGHSSQPGCSSQASSSNDWTPYLYIGGKWKINWDQKNCFTSTGTGERKIFFLCEAQSADARCRANSGGLDDIGKQQAADLGRRLSIVDDKKNLQLIRHANNASSLSTSRIIRDEIYQQGDNRPSITLEKTDYLLNGIPCPSTPFKPPSSLKDMEHELYKASMRFEAAFRKWMYRPGGTQQNRVSFEVFVCPANVIAYMVMRILQLPKEAWSRLFIQPSSTTEFLIRPNGSVYVVRIGERGYITAGFKT